MADNIDVTPGSGKTIAANNVGGYLYQRVKIGVGAPDTATDLAFGAAAAASSLPVTQSTEDVARMGSLTETAPSTDTASSGLNGRLQRVAQRLTTLIGAIPSSLGVKTAANSLSTTVASDDAGLAQLVAIAASAADTTTPVPVKSGVRYVDVTLSLDTSAYASGDLLADAQTVAALLPANDATAVLQSVMVIDEDNQKAAFTIYFANASSSFGTENSAPSITDANARTILGFVDVATGDYKNLGGVAVAFKGNLGMAITPVAGATNIYVAVVNGTGTPTYTASGVKLRIGVLA